MRGGGEGVVGSSRGMEEREGERGGEGSRKVSQTD